MLLGVVDPLFLTENLVRLPEKVVRARRLRSVRGGLVEEISRFLA